MYKNISIMMMFDKCEVKSGGIVWELCAPSQQQRSTAEFLLNLSRSGCW